MSCANRLLRTALHSIWLSKHGSLTTGPETGHYDTELFLLNEARLVGGYHVKLYSAIQWIRSFRWAYNFEVDIIIY